MEEGVFTWNDPKKIALSLKNSAENSTRRKATPYASSLSMLNFYINRAGKKLDPIQKKTLEEEKEKINVSEFIVYLTYQKTDENKNQTSPKFFSGKNY